MKKKTIRPERIFTGLPKLTQADREVVTIAIGNDKYCYRWLKTRPSAELVKHALELETAKGAGSRTLIEQALLARIIKLERASLSEKILKRKKSA